MKRGARLSPRDPAAGATFEVNASTAQLVRATRRPRALRDVISTPRTPEDVSSVVRLVLDGVLQIELGGRFVSGIDAWDRICDPPSRRVPKHRSARLTLEALEYAERLLPMPVTTLAYRLYRYNTIPCSPKWSARFPSSNAVGEQLGISTLERQPRFREKGWTVHARTGQTEPWLSWWREPSQRAHSADEPTYKLYVSPQPASMRDAFQTAARLIVDSDAFAFKVGGDVYGVLRPDKMVVYFASHAALMQAAGTLRTKLSGLRAHGVPFTAPLDADGLITCGVDPPLPDDGDPLARESWRLRIAGRLAASMAVAAQGSSRTLTPSRFALARLALDGTDLLAANGSQAARRFAAALRTVPR